MDDLLLGESPPIRELKNLIKRVAGTQASVLILGESGTGKELVARMLHEIGLLKDKPFIPVNCGAIPENLIESEMFGHDKGSFTGAVSDKLGLFEAADGGILFLDEVGELSPAMQVKLLRAIQEKKFRKVGGVSDVHVNVRIIAATNRDLEKAVAQGDFREDLYYRLNVIVLKTPPLRERKGDIRLLADRFLEKFCQRVQKDLHGFTSDAMKALEKYDWPGNVRELENVMERAVTLESGRKITLQCLPATLHEAADSKSNEPVVQSVITLPAPNFDKGDLNLDQTLAEVEKIYVLAAVKHARGVRKKAAGLLGLTLRSLRYRMRKLGLKD